MAVQPRLGATRPAIRPAVTIGVAPSRQSGASACIDARVSRVVHCAAVSAGGDEHNRSPARRVGAGAASSVRFVSASTPGSCLKDGAGNVTDLLTLLSGTYGYNLAAMREDYPKFTPPSLTLQPRNGPASPAFELALEWDQGMTPLQVEHSITREAQRLARFIEERHVQGSVPEIEGHCMAIKGTMALMRQLLALAGKPHLLHEARESDVYKMVSRDIKGLGNAQFRAKYDCDKADMGKPGARTLDALYRWAVRHAPWHPYIQAIGLMGEGSALLTRQQVQMLMVAVVYDCLELMELQAPGKLQWQQQCQLISTNADAMLQDMIGRDEAVKTPRGCIDAAPGQVNDALAPQPEQAAHQQAPLASEPQPPAEAAGDGSTLLPSQPAAASLSALSDAIMAIVRADLQDARNGGAALFKAKYGVDMKRLRVLGERGILEHLVALARERTPWSPHLHAAGRHRSEAAHLELQAVFDYLNSGRVVDAPAGRPPAEQLEEAGPPTFGAETRKGTPLTPSKRDVKESGMRRHQHAGTGCTHTASDGAGGQPPAELAAEQLEGPAMCCAITKRGTPCKRMVASAGTRCWQHK